jgi:hypothetical protein
MKARSPRRWTKEEDDLLRGAVAKYGTSTNPALDTHSRYRLQLRDSKTGEDASIDWHDVASCIEGRNNKDCRKRWIYSLEPSINKGPWDKEEDELLIQGVRLHGSRLVTISFS